MTKDLGDEPSRARTPYEVRLAEGSLTAFFVGEGRMPKCAPNPDFPNGTPCDMAPGGIGCTIELQHPTPCCGVWIINCDICGYSVGVTAAGRPDDPSTIRIACQLGAPR